MKIVRLTRFANSRPVLAKLARVAAGAGLAFVCCITAFSQTPADLTGYISAGPVMTGNVTVGKTGKAYLPATVDLYNVGSKTITAFHVVVDATFQDGHVVSNTPNTIDFITPLAAGSVSGVTSYPSGALSPGGSYQLSPNIALSGDRPQIPVKITARVLMLMFLDRTFVGDAKEAERTFGMRTSMAEDREELIAQVRKAESAPNPDSAYAAQLAANKSRAEAHLRVGVSADALERYRKAHGSRDVFPSMLAVDQAIAKLLREHSLPADSAQGAH